jgi:(p)ppGpp synthase/HD superfamily hydrolase
VGPHLVRDAGDLRPIAHRLGLNQTYRELQDLSFRHLHPWRYATLAKAMGAQPPPRPGPEGADEVDAAFARGMRCAWRARKTLYSIYRKMDEKHLSFAQVTDIYGFRIIVPDVIDCYTAWACCTSCTSRCPASSRTTSPLPSSTATSRCTPRWWAPRA